MTTLEPEQKDILEKLNEIVLKTNWGTVERVNGVPKAVVVIQEAMEEIKRLRMRIINWRNDVEADDKVRKETAKKILKDLKFLYSERAKEYTDWDTNKVKAVTIEWLNMDIAELAQEYGVELAEKNS